MIGILQGAIRAGARLGTRAFRRGGLLHHMWDSDAAHKAAAQEGRQRQRARKTRRERARRQRASVRASTQPENAGTAPATARQAAYAARLAQQAGAPAPSFAGWTFAEASAEIDRLGGVTLQNRLQQQRERIGADKDRLSTARTGRPAVFAGGGVDAHMQQSRDLQTEIATLHPDDPRYGQIHDELVALDDERQRLRDEAATEIWQLEQRAEELSPTSSEYLIVLEQIDTLEAQRDVLSRHNY